jgi:uncharacterized phage protein gp47/JayE
MSLATPTTRDLSDQIVAQIAASLSQSVPLLPKAFVRVLAWALAGAIVLVYKYAGFIFLQIFVAHASAQETTVNGKTLIPLVEWGVLLGVGRPNAATKAELLIAVSVTDQTGDLPAGTQLLYAPTRVVYVTTATVAKDAPTIQVTIRAASDDAGGDGSGDIGNLQPDDVVSFASTPAGVATDAVVVSQSVTAADAEDPEAYRARIVRFVQRRPQGGAYADYQTWAEEVEGIVHAYPYTGDNPGEVDVYIQATEASSGDPDGIPTGAQLTAVAEAIELEESGLATRRPVGAAVNVLPISLKEFDVEISGLDPDEQSTRDAIEDGLDEYLRSREPFIVGLSVLPRDDRITEAAVGGIVDDIVSALGAVVTVVELDPGPAWTLENGQKARLGTITFV